MYRCASRKSGRPKGTCGRCRGWGSNQVSLRGARRTGTAWTAEKRKGLWEGGPKFHVSLGCMGDGKCKQNSRRGTWRRNFELRTPAGFSCVGSTWAGCLGCCPHVCLPAMARPPALTSCDTGGIARRSVLRPPARQALYISPQGFHGAPHSKGRWPYESVHVERIGGKKTF